MVRIVVYLVILALTGTVAHAQTEDTSLRLRIQAESMRPGDTVVVEATGPQLLSQRKLSWYVNDVPVLQGIGNTSVTLTVPEVGTTHTVYAEMTTETGIEQSPTITIAGALVDIIWEGTGYTHPFYRGRALSGPDGMVNAEAHVLFIDSRGLPVPTDRIAFTWKLNDRVLKSLSGIGKNTIRIPAPPLYGEDILEVEAEDYTTYTRAEKKVRIPGVPPRTNLHPVDPLLGIQFSRVVGREGSTSDARASLIPYFTNITHLKDPGVSVLWFLFDNPLPNTGLSIVLPTTGILRAVYQNKQSLLDNTATRWSFLDSGDVEVEYTGTNVFSGENE